MFGKPVGKLGAVGGRTLIQRAIAVLRRYGQDAHIYLPGVGMLNGLQAGNYLDSAGTTQGTVDQPVGLVLDAAGGLGVELVTNGDFSNGLTGWAQSTANYWTAVGGRAYHAQSASYNEITKTITTTNSPVWIEFDYECLTAANTAQFFYINGAGVAKTSDINGLPKLAAGVGKIRYFATDGCQKVGFSRYTTAEFYIDNISVREVTGIAASQPTTSNKSVLKLTNGRYNWLFDSTDLLTATYPAGYESVTVIDARSTGQVTTAGANIVGAYSMGPSVTLYGRMIIRVAVSPSDLALLQGFANRLAGL